MPRGYFKNTDNMIKMVNDLLQLAKVEDYDNTIMDIKPVKAREAMSNAWKECLPAAESKGVSLHGRPSIGWADCAGRFRSARSGLRNLLENAVKYSPAGGKIEVFSSLESGKITIGVSDSGPGIPKQDRQRIFERFFRVERHRCKETGSTGLGLAICRHIIRNHGGDDLGLKARERACPPDRPSFSLCPRRRGEGPIICDCVFF